MTIDECAFVAGQEERPARDVRRQPGSAERRRLGEGAEVVDAVEGARDTAINPVVLDAFAMAISSSAQQHAYPGVAGHEPDAEAARRNAAAIDRAMGQLRAIGGEGAYLSESDYFMPGWREASWGANYPRLAEIKAEYDPDGLFRVHHGVGSEG